MTEGTETGSGRRSVSFGHPPPQSEADELVPAGLEEVLDVFFPAQTHGSCEWFSLGRVSLAFIS